MDVPMTNDSGYFCRNSGNGLNTGMPIDMRVQWDEDSSLLAGLYMPLVSVCHQLFGDFNSEFDREELLFVAGSEYPCAQEGALCTLDVPLEGTLFRCEISTQRTM